jgi:hypothetical protein
MSPEQMIEELEKIKVLSHEEMARLQRFAPSGHIYFDKRLPLSVAFEMRFKGLGGMTPEVSKKIGLG